MHASRGILTARGGMTSHAALVARQMGKVCVVGCADLEIDYQKRRMVVGDRVIREGNYISLDGTAGEVYAGQIPTRPSEILRVIIDKSLSPKKSSIYNDFMSLMVWADEFRRLGVWANADQPNQAEEAIAFGAEGIGLTRTEHMFFDGDRIDAVREMILAEDLEGREKALSKLLPMQREDFKGLFRVMKERPVTIRTWTRRFTSSCRTTKKISRSSQPGWVSAWNNSAQRCRACTKPTRCSGIVGAALESFTRKLRPCRRVPLLKPRAR